jgi:hypothetical protein
MFAASSLNTTRESHSRQPSVLSLQFLNFLQLPRKPRWANRDAPVIRRRQADDRPGMTAPDAFVVRGARARVAGDADARRSPF